MNFNKKSDKKMPRMRLDQVRKNLKDDYIMNWESFMETDNLAYSGVCMGLSTALIYLGVEPEVLKKIRESIPKPTKEEN